MMGLFPRDTEKPEQGRQEEFSELSEPESIVTEKSSGPADQVFDERRHAHEGHDAPDDVKQDRCRLSNGPEWGKMRLIKNSKVCLEVWKSFIIVRLLQPFPPTWKEKLGLE